MRMTIVSWSHSVIIFRILHQILFRLYLQKNIYFSLNFGDYHKVDPDKFVKHEFTELLEKDSDIRSDLMQSMTSSLA